MSAAVSTHGLADRPWIEAGKEGIYYKAVRQDHRNGLYLGLLAFDPFARSGVHQHLGTAISFFVDGGLTDFQGTASTGDAGINLPGATHDAISYRKSLLVSRLEGPVVYPDGSEPIHELHAGAHHNEIVNRNPEVLPDINIRVDTVPRIHTGIPWLARQLIFDYGATGDNRRFAQLQLLPGCDVPYHRTRGLIDLFIRGGDLVINNSSKAVSGEFVVIEPGAEVSFRSEHGCLLLAWAEASIEWSQECSLPDLYGF